MIVIGGGIIGLSVAIELRLRGVSVTVLSHDAREAAGFVAAGMIAPQAERIPPSPMLELCLRSRAMYADWIRKLEAIAGLDAGYWPCGILAPVYAPVEGIAVENSINQWCDRETIRQLQPGLGDDVIGGWWYPQDAQVDNRRALMQCLQVAARELGVEVIEGVTVEEIERDAKRVRVLKTSHGEMTSDRYILAAGARSGQFFSLPVYPIKGQMLSLRVPPSARDLPLQRVLFGEEIYIVPRRDGLIVLGATVEDVGFTPGTTPEGKATLLENAIRLFPILRDFPVEESWWGYRPATPDENPILGDSPYSNLTLATGHYRNGILLAPVTATLIADAVLEERYDPLFEHFCWDRFLNQ
ncbi:glycine oxidase ThiO [Oscillatoria sp. FACHB-1406]|uniref:glycine oxidase ThiO n=1 Tax=Oscillatoria sp. FACHB-1406 TaxID=2692846 RepID=UPI00168499E4|nr:glycine oxidase ThiO [Oscillatoria sp. FACHB-1406]MBD2577249.1 glycine oxidase ThiO [Oscillatoria sp. FACHB-1406]